MADSWQIVDERWLEAFGWGGLVDPSRFTGICLVRGGHPVIMGGVEMQDVRGWCLYEARVRAPRTVHRRAIELLLTVKRAGCETLFAIPDPRIDRAQVWLKRFNFAPDAPNEDGMILWRLDLGGGSSTTHDSGNCPERLRGGASR